MFLPPPSPANAISREQKGREGVRVESRLWHHDISSLCLSNLPGLRPFTRALAVAPTNEGFGDVDGAQTIRSHRHADIIMLC